MSCAFISDASSILIDSFFLFIVDADATLMVCVFLRLSPSILVTAYALAYRRILLGTIPGLARSFKIAKENYYPVI
jgi:hypothetical protein